MKAIFDRNGCSRLNGTIGAALGLITLLYCTTTFNVILPSYSYSVHGVLNLAVLSFNTLLGLYCYLACVLVDPGRVPQGWQPELEQQPTQPQLLEVKSDGTHRYCAKCQAYKPPRAHHCRRCGRCVLRMDHHCIWVNNCIGHGNYRAFLLMCFYLAAAALHALVLLFRYDLHLFSLLGKPPRGAAARLLAQHAQRSQGGGTAGAAAAAAVKKATAAAGLRTAVHRPGPVTTVRLSAAEALALVARQQPGVRGPDWPGPVWLHAMAQVCASAVALPVTLALLGLLGWNLHLLLRNQTTIEHHEGVRVQLLLQGKPPEGAGGAAPQAASKVVGEAGGRAGGMGSSGSSGSLQGLHRASKSPAGSGGSLGGSGASSVVGTSVPAAPPAPTVSSTLVTTGGGGGPGEGAGAQERRQPQSMAAAVAPPAAQPEVPPSGPPLPRRPVPVRQCKARRHPYDQGYYGNLRGVFGDWEALWCLPLRHGACGDGLAFPTRQDAC